MKSRKAVIGVVGLGYIGLPLALCFAESGYRVIGFDVDAMRVDLIAQGVSHVSHVDNRLVSNALELGFRATTDISYFASVDVIILCVPTPLNKNREPNLSYITDTTDSMLPYLKAGQLIALTSTTYPGTTEEELLPRLESTGLKVGTDIFLIYSPEREDPGNVDFTTRSIPKVCGGITESCLAIGMVLYEQIVGKVVPVSSTQVAEMTKLLENIHRAVNIGLVNEMKILTDRMGINIYEVIGAAMTKPFGFTPYFPGPGLGGHCIPIDPFYLTWKAREYNVSTRFIELAGEVNTTMPKWVVMKVVDTLNEYAKAVKNARILILGVAYKKNVDDMRESPSTALISLLKEKGALIDYSDPHVPFVPRMGDYKLEMKSTDLSPSVLSAYDLVLLATDHDIFDYDMIRKHSRLIVDTRGRYAMSPAPHIVLA